MNYKILLLSLFTFTSLVLSAQNDLETTKATRSFPRHEIKFNPVFALLSLPEISYEYVINGKTSAGLSFGYTIDQEHLDLDFFILPYYKYFLGKKKMQQAFS